MTQNHTKVSKLEKISIAITDWVGTPVSIIVHTLFFIFIFGLMFFGFTIDSILLILTTAVSLEAIYLAIFIQMTVNRNTTALANVEKDIDEIQEDVGEIEGDVDEIHEHVEELGDDVDEIQKDVGEIGGDVDKIQVHVEDLGEDVDDMSEDIDKIHGNGANIIDESTHNTLVDIQLQLKKISDDLDKLKEKGLL